MKITRNYSKNITKAAFFALATLLLQPVDARARTRLRAPKPKPEDDKLLCHVLSVDVIYNDTNTNESSDYYDDDEHLLRCEPEGQDPMTYELDLPSDFVAKERPYLSSGNAMIEVPHGVAVRGQDTDEPKVEYPSDASITLVDENDDRRLTSSSRKLRRDRRTGLHEVLVVRVTALDSEVSVTRRDISRILFGVGKHAPPVDLLSQYHKCSFGKLPLRAARGIGIINGVTEIQVNINVTGINIFALEGLVNGMVQEKFGGPGDHPNRLVAMAMPPGPLLRGRRYIAYALINSYRSVFNDNAVTNWINAMHEIGHNIGLRHSGENGSPYQDISGIMGHTSVTFQGSCFNAQKNWFLGWYSDRSTELDMSEAFSGRLFAFVDYNRTSPEDTVLIKIGDHLFVQYNRARSFNEGTREKRDQVAIVFNEDVNTDSTLLGGLAEDDPRVPDSYRFPDFEGRGVDLVIEICDQVYGPPDYVRISIYLDDGIQGSTCDYTQAPSASPTVLSTPAPTTSLVPSTAPSIKLCEDQPGSFLTGENDHSSMDCPSLARDKAAQAEYCVPSHPAYDFCEDTCGKCDDGCQDTRNYFLLNSHSGYVNCVWLSTRPIWQERLCHPDHDAFYSCGETCNSCEMGIHATRSPTASPNSIEMPTVMPICDDSKTEEFYVEELQQSYSCTWLAGTLGWQRRLCVPGHEAWRVCPETCGACSDDCTDDQVTLFQVNRVRPLQNCAWLAKRPLWRQFLCREGSQASELCRETCDTCTRGK